MRVHITGITGTVGSAFADYLINHGYTVTGIDHNEERVADMRRRLGIDIKCGNFDAAFTADVVVHLAAMKHIDLCEQNTISCVDTNVISTKNLFEHARRTGADILFMSTDKAVEPNSVYGYTKALGEHLVKEYGGCFARSGNVIASNGSVFHIWEEAIRSETPLCITHKDMRRYFITPENLVERVWKGYLKGEREIIPDMDSHVKLVDLAMEMLTKHGYTLETYKPGIKYIGLRGTEKIEEKLTWEYEQ